MRFLLFLIITVFFCAGCKNNNVAEKQIEKIYEDVANILPKAKLLKTYYLYTLPALFDESEFPENFDEIVSIVDKNKDKFLNDINQDFKKIADKISLLNNFKEKCKDKKYYNYVYTSAKIQLIDMLANKQDETPLHDTIAAYLDLLNMYIEPLNSVLENNIDLWQYVKNKVYNTPIYNRSTGLNYIEYIDEVIDEIKLNEEDRVFIQKIVTHIKTARVFGSPTSLLSLNIIDYFSDEYNNIELNMYIEKRMYEVIYSGIADINVIIKDKYNIDVFKQVELKVNIDSGINDIKNVDMLPACLYPAFLDNSNKEKCIEYIKTKNIDDIMKTQFKAISGEIKDRHLQNLYILVNNKLCMASDNGTYKFYDKNEICKAIEKTIK